ASDLCLCRCHGQRDDGVQGVSRLQPRVRAADQRLLEGRIKVSINLPRVIGLYGYAGSGKDTVGHTLESLKGYARAAYADPLRQAAEEINPYIPEPLDAGAPHGWRRGLIKRHGWRGAKDGNPWVREFLADLGNAIRDLDPDFWVRLAEERIRWLLVDSPGVTVTDVRFPNEYESIKRLGGVMVRVTRPGCNPANEIDNLLDDYEFDSQILNDGSLHDLRDAILNGVIAEVEMVHELHRKEMSA